MSNSRYDAAMFVLSALIVRAQNCPVDIPNEEKRDCYPWYIENAQTGQQLCEDMGCVWCDEGVGIPACFFDDLVGKSL